MMRLILVFFLVIGSSSIASAEEHYVFESGTIELLDYDGNPFEVTVRPGITSTYKVKVVQGPSMYQRNYLVEICEVKVAGCSPFKIGTYNMEKSQLEKLTKVEGSVSTIQDLLSTASGVGTIEEVECPDCNPNVLHDDTPPMFIKVGGPGGATASIALRKQVGGLVAHKSFNRMCKTFINSNGDLGRAGNEVVRAVNNYASSCMNTKLDVSNVCPNFKKFTQGEKDLFWVYVFASIAQHESSCDAGESARGVNDKADGLFQMEYSFSQRRDAGRDRNLCKTRGPHDSQDIRFQTECSVSIIRDINCKYGKPLDWKKGYWHLLRNNSSFGIGKKIRKFPGCYSRV